MITAIGWRPSMSDLLKVVATNTDVLLLEPKVYSDARGFFFESYNRKLLAEAIGVKEPFVQDNHSRSVKHVLRGLHYQIPKPQGKLVRVITGEVFDVAVDMRRSSPTFGQWTGLHLVAEKEQMVWIPPGFAHGFVALSPAVDFLYKTTDYYDPNTEQCLKWNDPIVGIRWPIHFEPIMSFKDAHGKPFNTLPYFP